MKEYQNLDKTNVNVVSGNEDTWEHIIRDANDYEQHINYIHYNPVKHGYIHSPYDWKYSSIHRFIKDGILSKDWACDNFNKTGYGE
jgi:putative transposase